MSATVDQCCEDRDRCSAGTRSVVLAFVAVAGSVGCKFPPPADVPDDDVTSGFAIGGEVHGLWTGGSITLHLAAGDVVEDVVANGTEPFVFEHRLDDGASYLVSVSDDGPDHDCVVSAGSGRIDAAEVLDLSVDCTNLIPHTIAISTPVAFTFDPRVTRYTLPVSVLQQGVEVVVNGATLNAATVAGQSVPIGQASPTVPLGQGTTTVPVVVTKGALSQRYELVFDRGAAPIAEATHAQASNAGNGDAFGWAVAASGDYVAIGAPAEDSSTEAGLDDGAVGSGALYVFRRSGSTWLQTQILKGTAITASRGFGIALAMDRDVLVVGARNDGARGAGAGAIYVFRLDAATSIWREEQRITASDAHAGDWFGAAVAVRGDLIVVGAPRHDRGNSSGDYGVVYALVRSGGVWGEQATIRDPGTQVLDEVGWPLALDGDTVVVGDSNGHVRLYRRTGSTWMPETTPPSCTGASFDIEGDTLAVGQPSDASGNGQPGDQSAPASGAVRVYARAGTTWSEMAYLKAASPQAFARMGLATAIQDNVIVTTVPASNGLQAFQKIGGSWVAEAPRTASQSASTQPIYGMNIALTANGSFLGSGEDDGDGPAGGARGAAWFFH